MKSLISLIAIFSFLTELKADDFVDKAEFNSRESAKQAVNQIEEMIKNKMDLSEIDQSGNNRLHEAAISNNIEAARLLLKNGLDPDVKNKSGFTALHYAAYYGSFDVLKAIISKGSMLDAKNAFGETALHIACQNNKEDIAKYLVEKGADINIKSKHFHSPFLLAVSHSNNKNLIKFLIDHGANLHINGQLLYELADRLESKEIKDFLLNRLNALNTKRPTKWSLKSLLNRSTKKGK